MLKIQIFNPNVLLGIHAVENISPSMQLVLQNWKEFNHYKNKIYQLFINEFMQKQDNIFVIKAIIKDKGHRKQTQELQGLLINAIFKRLEMIKNNSPQEEMLAQKDLISDLWVGFSGKVGSFITTNENIFLQCFSDKIEQIMEEQKQDISALYISVAGKHKNLQDNLKQTPAEEAGTLQQEAYNIIIEDILFKTQQTLEKQIISRVVSSFFFKTDGGKINW